jgi:hypothetical protein
MDNETRLSEITKEIETLHSCFRGMDLPDHRKMNNSLDNLKWLSKNMGHRNGKHPRYQEAMRCLTRLIDELKYT